MSRRRSRGETLAAAAAPDLIEFAASRWARASRPHSALPAFGLFALAAAVCRPGSLTIPLDRDTGIYLYVGDTILRGQLPYADAAENKGPVTFLLFAAIRLVAGHSAMVVRVVLLLFTALAALAVARYVAHFAGHGAGVLAGLTLAVLGSSPVVDGENAQSEQFGVAPMAAAWWLATGRTRWRVAGAGALTAVAALMNPGFVAVAPIVLFEILRAPGARDSRLARVVAGCVGGLVVVVPVAAWLAAGDALDDMAAQSGAHALAGVASASLSARLSPANLLDFSGRGLFAMGVVGSVLGLRSVRLRPVAVGALLWIGVMWARVQLSGYTHKDHLYYPAIPGIAVGVALGAVALWTAERRVQRALLAVALAWVAYAYVVRPQADLAADVSPDLRLAYPASDFIRGHTNPEDEVFFAGSMAPGYWLSDRHAPTRFFHVTSIQWQRSYPAERRRELFTHPPQAVAELPEGAELEREVDHLPELVPELLKRFPYRLAYNQDGAKVWLLAR